MSSMMRIEEPTPGAVLPCCTGEECDGSEACQPMCQPRAAREGGGCSCGC